MSRGQSHEQGLVAVEGILMSEGASCNRGHSHEQGGGGGVVTVECLLVS